MPAVGPTTPSSFQPAASVVVTTTAGVASMTHAAAVSSGPNYSDAANGLSTEDSKIGIVYRKLIARFAVLVLIQ